MLRIFFAGLFLFAALDAQTIVRLGTLAPKGSRWLDVLEQMGKDWNKASGGKVELKIYPGGEQGDEPAMVQKVRIKKLQAVALSGAGLSGIDASVSALQIPLMYDSDQELDFVRDRIGPRIEKEMAQRGFIVLNWADAGWVHFFTKKPASHPDEIRAMKLCVLQGDNATFEIYRRNGFHPVALAATDITTGLKTGLIDAFQSPALAALSMQWFSAAPNMLDIKFTPLVGATLITKDTWESIPAALRADLLKISRAAGPPLRDEIRKLEATSVGMMQQFGLNVVHADPAAVAEWHKLVEGLYPQFRGTYVSPELFDEAQRLRDEYRKDHPAAAPAKSPAKPK